MDRRFTLLLALLMLSTKANASVHGRGIKRNDSESKQSGRKKKRQTFKTYHRGEILNLGTDKSALYARLKLIREAKSEILYSTFEFHHDSVGLMVLAELQRAAKRGVKVTLLLDDYGSSLSTSRLTRHLTFSLRNGLSIPPEYFEILLNSKVNIQAYNTVFKKEFPPIDPQSLKRMHGKLLIVDGETLLIGARNTGESYFGVEKTGVFQYINNEAIVKGGVVKESKNYFDALIAGQHVESIGPEKVAIEKLANAQVRLNRIAKVTSRFLERNKAEWQKEKSDRPKTLRFLHDDPNKLDTSSGMKHEVYDLLARAKNEIVIYAAFLVPTEEMLNALNKATSDGVQVIIYANDVSVLRQPRVKMGLDNRLSVLGLESQLEALSKAGITLYLNTQKSPATKVKDVNKAIHLKGMFVDGRYSHIGSFNPDPRSEDSNHEVVLELDSVSFAKKQLKYTEHLEKHSILLIDRGEFKGPQRFMNAKKAAGVVMKAVGLYDQL